MSEKEKIRIECLSELLEGHGVILTAEALAQIADDFYHHIQMESEMESYRHVNPNPEPEFVPADMVTISKWVGPVLGGEQVNLGMIGVNLSSNVPLYMKNPKRR